MKSSLGLDFLDRTLRTSGILILIFLPFGLVYLGLYHTIAILSGSVWGIVNFIFLSALVRRVINPEGDRRGAMWLALIKFPLLYAAGYGLLMVPLPGFTPGWLLSGFSIILMVMFLKALGRVLIKANDGHNHNKRIQEAG